VADDSSPLPQEGERVITIGQTGSGKTTLNLQLLRLLPTSPTIIYDTKEEPKFETLENSRVVTRDRDIYDALADESVDYVIYRPHKNLLAEPELLDSLLDRHYEDFKGTACYIDELYSFHRNGRAGRGLVALYTRGRSRGITTIASSQQPKWISKFSMSEAQLFYLFHLNIRDHRKTVSDSSGMPELPNPPKYHFYVYRIGDEFARLCKPVKMEGLKKWGYTDNISVSALPERATEEIGHVWL
jgi:ABC-type oligopeptide transport system ATPase subunit